jgi:hypothetical protein
MVEPIKVEGLAEFSRSLKRIDASMPKALRLALNDASNVVIDYARPRVPRRTGRAARSIKAASTRTASRVSAGGARAPYYPWLDFGGRVGRRRSVARPFYKEGRYLYKSLIVKRERFTQVMESALQRVARDAGLSVADG